MSMRFCGTSQNALFHMEVDFFSAVFIIDTYIILESVSIFFIRHPFQRFLNAWP